MTRFKAELLSRNKGARDEGVEHLLKQQAQCAFSLPGKLAQAVGPLPGEERDGGGGVLRAGARQRARHQRLARTGLPIKQDPPASMGLFHRAFGTWPGRTGSFIWG